jgi:ubiquinone/menaquinone biosynthesis C-methylase UbiE
MYKGFNLAHATDRPMLEVLSKDPVRAKRFAEAMSLFNSSSGMETKSVVNNYSWASLPDGAVVVDVGGSHGDVAISLARKYPKLTYIVQDLPNVVASAKVPYGLEEQVSFMAHDFFADQPVKEADVYFFKWIFHDWPDKYCIKILKALIPALKKGARIVVNEFIVPPPGALPAYLETGIW